MNPAQQNFITRVGQQARRAHDLYALSEELDTLFNGTPNYSALITQNEIDSVPSFQQAGITVAEVAAAVYILKMINTQLSTIDFPALVVMANLG